MQKKKRKKKIIIISFTAVLLISSILYMLAYRYLIERAETPLENNISTRSSSNTSAVASIAPAKPSYDDWNYKSDNIEINIEKVEKGAESNKVTYYVADVTLKDSSYLNSAFAKNTFGRNIIEATSDIAKDNGAIFAINGDYYGFRGDGILIRNGIVYRDTPTRTAAAFYKNGKMETFDEAEVSSEELLSNGVTNTLSFGPILVKNGRVKDDFESVIIDTNFGNKSIQNLNPRTGIGIIEPYHYVFIVVDGRKENYSKGMTLSEFAQVFEDLGCTEAYNLDGGGSSTMYFMGRVVNNPSGEGKERPISDILLIKE